MTQPSWGKGRSGRKRRWGMVITTMFAALLLAAAYAFLHSPYFEVKEVYVTGLETVTPEEIVRRSGLQTRVLIWRVQPVVLSERVREHPAVAGASVVREWPDRVRIDILEREPVAVLAYRDHWFLVDMDGVPLAIRETRPSAYVELRGNLSSAPPLGEPLPTPLAESAQAAAYVRQYKLDWVEAVEMAPDGLILWLQGEIPAYFGNLRTFPDQKFAVLSSLWSNWSDQADKLHSLDVRDPEHPAVRTVPDLEES